MKTPQLQPAPRRGLLAILGISLCLAAGTASSFAADKTWDGGGDQSSWTNSPANWDLDTDPVPNDSLFFAGTTGLFTVNNFPADTDFTGITFNAGAGSFVLTGAEVDLLGGVMNQSVNPQQISLNLDQTASQVHHAIGDMIYDGVVKNNALIKYGPGTITLQGGPAENSSLRAEVYEGVLALGKTGTKSLTSSPIIVSGTGTIRLVNGAGTDQIHFSQRVLVENGGTFDVQNNEEISSLRSASSSSGVVLNNLAGEARTLTVGGGSNKRGAFYGNLTDGAGILNFKLARNGHLQVFGGNNTYSGTTVVLNNNSGGKGPTRLIVDGTHTGGGAYEISSSQLGASLGGSGSIIASAVAFNAGGFVSPGGLVTDLITENDTTGTFQESTAILTLASAVSLNDANSSLDVQLNGTTAGSGYDQVVIAGSGSFLNNNANLKLTLGFTPATGNKFTIVQVQGSNSASNVGIFASLNGVVTDLSQGATFVDPGSGKQLRISYRAEGSTFDAGEGLGNDIMLEVVAAAGKDLTWRGDVNNAWDTTTANWRTAGGGASTFANRDFVTFNDSGANTLPLDLTTDVTPATFLFDATKDYVLAGAAKFTGTVILTKMNTGTLTLVTDNNNTGTTSIEQGTIRVGTNGTTGTISGSVAVNTDGTFVHSRADDVTLTTTLSGTGSFLHTGDGALILAANSPFSGRTTSSGGLLQLGTGVGIDGSINGDVHVSGTNVLRYLYAGDLTIGNSKSGNGTVIYEAATGNRSFIIPASLDNSNFTGSNYIAAGVRLRSVNPNPGYTFGNGGTVAVADFGQVHVETSSIEYNQEFFLQGDGWTGDATPLGAMRIYQATVSGPVHLLANTRIGGTSLGGTISGTIDGAFQLEVLGNQNSFILRLGPTSGANTYASTLVTRGAIRANNSGGISSGALTVDLLGAIYVFGNNVTVASLNNGPNGGGVIYNRSADTYGTLTVGTDNTPTSFDGVFGNGDSQALGLTKVGTGTLTLSGVNTNTGDVTVNGGTLALTGAGSFGHAALISVGSSAFYDVTAAGGTLTLNSGQTLGGSGTVNGNVVSSPGSTIAPGTSVGTLTVAGSVTLGGDMTMELNRSLSPNSDRLLTSGGSITGGGTLTTTNIGPALQAGDTFQLFATGVSGIAANLQTTDAVNGVTYTWQDNIASSGSITVQSVTPPGAPPTLGFSQSGNSLTFSWTGPFKLQSQTNSLSVGISTNWGNYPGGSTSPVVVTINPADPTVFFRLSLQ